MEKWDRNSSIKTERNNKSFSLEEKCDQAWWLMPVIPATRETEIGRLVI
jgi:hypothetical protein